MDRNDAWNTRKHNSSKTVVISKSTKICKIYSNFAFYLLGSTCKSICKLAGLCKIQLGLIQLGVKPGKKGTILCTLICCLLWFLIILVASFKAKQLAKLLRSTELCSLEGPKPKKILDFLLRSFFSRKCKPLRSH